MITCQNYSNERLYFQMSAAKISGKYASRLAVLKTRLSRNLRFIYTHLCKFMVLYGKVTK